MEITAYGKPGPQGSKKYMGKNSQGTGIILNTSPKLIPWRNAVSVAATLELERLGWPQPFDCALDVMMVFTFTRPKAATRSKRPHPSVFPDLSKIVRATEDALSDAGVWKDDALVVQLTARKTYENEHHWALPRPGVVIHIAPVVPWEQPPGRGKLEIEA